jgi:hypothetical protein
MVLQAVALEGRIAAASGSCGESYASVRALSCSFAKLSTPYQIDMQ